MRLLTVFILCLIVFATNPQAADAQGNLLSNPGFEEPYSTDYLRKVASGWTPWIAAGNPDYYPEIYGSVFSGGRSQAMLTGGTTFTAGLYQVVPNIPAGKTVRASAWAKIFVALSDNLQGTYSHMRVGIDPNGGTNPHDGDIVWSGTFSSADIVNIDGNVLWTEYRQLSTEAISTGDSVTIFLWGAQNWPAGEHRQFWDNAELYVVGYTPTTTTNTPTTTTVTSGALLESCVQLNVRSGPGIGYGIIGGIYPGTPYAIVSEHTDWYGISYKNATGYVHAGYVTVSSGQSAATVTSSSTSGVIFSSIYNLSFRVGPSTRTNRLAIIPAGTVVAVIGRNDSNSWLQVNYNGQTGWVAWWLGGTSGAHYNTLPITG
jgi:uncharacterized protein YraI